jgi:hypothetical protein
LSGADGDSKPPPIRDTVRTMLKCLAILAVVCAVTQALVPASGQAPDNGANNGNHASQSTKSGEDPAPAIAPVPAQNDRRESLKPETGDGPGDTQQGAVNITNTTPMPVPWSLPKWAVWIGWVASLILTGFLIWGVLVARGTLKAIETQTVEVAKAATATEAAVVAAETSYKLARDTSERELRAYLTVSNARLFLYEDGFIEPRLTISNSGQTPAYEFRGIQGLSLDGSSPPPSKPSDDFLLRYGTVGRDYSLTGEKRQVGATKQQVIAYLTTGYMHLILYGWYKYQDVFGHTHPLEFRLVVSQRGTLSMGRDSENEWLVFFDDWEAMPDEHQQEGRNPN